MTTFWNTLGPSRYMIQFWDFRGLADLDKTSACLDCHCAVIERDEKKDWWLLDSALKGPLNMSDPKTMRKWL